MADERAKDDRDDTPVERDSEQPIAGRQPQRPGQHGRYQPRPGERDAATLPSVQPEGFAGDDPPQGVIPTSQKPRLGQPPGRPDGE
jgi:hypothetical protein